MSERDEILADISSDRAWLAGYKAGWNHGQTDNHDAHDRVITMTISEISEATKLLSTQQEQPK